MEERTKKTLEECKRLELKLTEAEKEKKNVDKKYTQVMARQTWHCVCNFCGNNLTSTFTSQATITFVKLTADQVTSVLRLFYVCWKRTWKASQISYVVHNEYHRFALHRVNRIYTRDELSEAEFIHLGRFSLLGRITRLSIIPVFRRIMWPNIDFSLFVCQCVLETNWQTNQLKTSLST